MSLSSDEVNFLIYRYLLEAGFSHSAFVFGCESSVGRTSTDGKAVPLGALLMFIQKGFQFMELEANLNEEGTDVYAEYTPLSARDILTKDISELRASVRELRDRHIENGAMAAGPHEEASELGTRQLAGHTDEVYTVAWRDSAGLLASAAADGAVRIWDLRNDHPTVCGGSSGDQPLCIDWSPDGQTLAAGTKQGSVLLLSKDGTLSNTLTSDAKQFISIKWNKKGDALVTGDAGGTLIVWDVKQASIRQRWASTHGPVFDLDWRNNTIFAAGFMDGTTCMYKVGTEDPLRSCTCYEPDVPSLVNSHDINAVRWDPSGKLMAAASTGSSHVWVWTGQGDAAPKILQGHKREVMCLAWGGNGGKAVLASGSNDGSVRLWDVEKGHCAAVLDPHQEGISVLAWSPDGVHLATGDEGGNVSVWSVRERRVVRSTTCSNRIAALTWTDGGAAIAIASAASPTVVVAVFD